MNKKEAYTLFLLAAIYLVVHYMQAHGRGPVLLRFYGKDLTLIPFLILGISSASALFNISVKIRFKELILTVIVCIVGFEFIFPRFGMAFERDMADMLCYIAGGLFYYIVFLRSAEKHKIQVDTGTLIDINRL
ncbi:hypothetical protein G3O08_03165 [Cryomorpha ignava]|uniref:Magnesium citrate secondary transporter n=1 Tax=Cryomorpha ignava TaxID=101383 RepID=A0A7K3WNR7_9FLAO|nr:hypothetical protein [Cryomorpha ignava]NEN22502.1 hypothetical protein [Cryomorpha ignava]